MKKCLSLLLAIIAIFTVALPASAASTGSTVPEFELVLDESGRGGAIYGYVIYENETRYYDLSNASERAAYAAIQKQANTGSRAIQPLSIGSLHVGIEMKDSQYQMYYEVKGTGLLYVDGYMKCKSTAILFATTFHDEYFTKSSLGSTSLSGTSSKFDLPSGTTKVKVGWHDVTIKDGDGYAYPTDQYASVPVG